MIYFDPDFLKFFKELAPNNNKEWFDANRKRYQKSVKEPFETFVEKLMEALKKEENLGDTKPGDCIFRINRDIRFSKDKTPYKTNTSALITPGGRKNLDYPALYIELGPEKLAIYTGEYMPATAKVQKIREHIAANAKRYEKITGEKRFKLLYGDVQGEKQTRVPKELKEAAEKLPVIYQKQFYIVNEAKPDTIIKEDVLKHVLNTYRVAQPFVEFLREIE